MTTRLWDYIFLAGWEGIFRLAVSILGLMQDQLLALDDMESVAMLMKEWKKPGYLIQFFSFQELLDKAATLIINEEVLLKLQESFANEVLSMAVIVKYLQEHPEENNQNNSNPTEILLDMTQTAIIKKALPLGVEPPTFWLMRYGYKLSTEQTMEMNKVHEELLAMDRQVDRDKQVLQAKILKACEYHRDVEDHLQQVLSILADITEQLQSSQQQFHTAVQDAQLIATKASAIMETLGSLHPSEVQASTTTTSTSSSSSHNSSSSHHSSSGGFHPMKILHEGPLRKLLFKKCYAEARQMTESLNHLIEKAAQVQEGEAGDDEVDEGEEDDEEEQDEEDEEGSERRMRSRTESGKLTADEEEEAEEVEEYSEDKEREKKGSGGGGGSSPGREAKILETEEQMATGSQGAVRHSSLTSNDNDGDVRFARSSSMTDYTPRLAMVSVETSYYTSSSPSATSSVMTTTVTTSSSSTQSHGSGDKGKREKDRTPSVDEENKKRLSDPLSENPLMEETYTTSHSTSFLKKHSSGQRKARRNSKELERERIAQEAKRLSLKIDHLAGTPSFSSKSDRFSFTGTSTTSASSSTKTNQNNTVQPLETSGRGEEEDKGGADDRRHGHRNLTSLYRYARRWAPLRQEAPPSANSPRTMNRTMSEELRSLSIDPHSLGEDSTASRSPTSGSFLAPLQSLPSEISHKLSHSMGSIHSMISSTFSSNSTHSSSSSNHHNNAQYSLQQRTLSTSSTGSTSPLPLKEIEEPTSSPSLITQSCQLKSLEQASQKAQKRIIHAHRNMEYQKNALKKYQETMEELKMKEEELNHFKKRLCDQLQLLVEDSNRCRSQKLLFVSESYTV